MNFCQPREIRDGPEKAASESVFFKLSSLEFEGVHLAGAMGFWCVID